MDISKEGLEAMLDKIFWIVVHNPRKVLEDREAIEMYCSLWQETLHLLGTNAQEEIRKGKSGERYERFLAIARESLGK